MSAPAYESYKDSGVEWIGAIPSHWSHQSLWTVAEECDRSNEGMVEDNLLSLSYGRIVRKDIDNNDGLLPASFETYQIVEPNDVVWRLTDLQNDKRSLRTARVTERGIITSAYLATRPIGVSSSFFSYLLRAYDLMKVFYSMGGGLRQGMKFSDVKHLPILLPSATEQTAIAVFLDRETGKIDALIEAQTRLIELLKEKRQAVISHAVTKGLNPDAPMKDSGIEWLGQVPAHWKIKSLGALAEHIQTGPFGSQVHAEDYIEGGIPLINPSNIKNGSIVYDKKITVSYEKAEDLAQHALKSGDIIIARRGELGRCAVVRDSEQGFLCGTGSLKVRIDNAYAPYVAEFIRTPFCVEALKLKSVGATMDNLNAEIVSKISITVPSLQEQKEIISGIVKSTHAIDRLIVNANLGIELLSERRAALISAAVTGKIDVRGLVNIESKAA